MKKKTAKKTGPSVAIGAIPSPDLPPHTLKDFVNKAIGRAEHLSREIKSKAGGEAKALDYLIQRFLEDYHKKLITTPEINATKDNIVPGNRLVYDFIEAVASGDNDLIQKIAAGVSRVHTRATGRKDSFTITPADQARARVFAYFDENGPPQSLAQTRAAMLATGNWSGRNGNLDSSTLDPKEVQRWHKDLGGASGKRGRPSKTKITPKAKKTAVVPLKEIRARATAASAKLPRLLDQKPVAKNRTKHSETSSD